LRRNSNKGLYLFFLLLIALVGGGYYVYTSTLFERNPPKVDIPSEIYWNLKQPLHLTITDDTGIKEYSIVMKDGKGEVTIEKQVLTNPAQEIRVKVDPPGTLEFPNKRAILEIKATDKSFWHYFLGNTTHKQIKIHIDTKRPNLFIVDNSYGIRKGGSALVVFYCNDENLVDFYVQTNFGKKFKAQPFYKEGYYVALIAWPITQEKFRAFIVAFDKANNKAKTHIPYYLKDKKYKTTRIELEDDFLQGKVAALAEEYPETKGMTLLEKFKFINETLREKNEKLIHDLTSIIPKERISSFTLKQFYPLKNGAVVATFGDHRYYYYKGKFVSESYHMGLDLASTKHAKIKASNKGEVVFSDFNGIYGNMPLISHGLGLYTLYGHCSSMAVKKGDKVKEGMTIAKTGSTGLALGDHLHFGVVVQGIEVRPQEWMDGNWIKLNVTQVIENAKKIIDSK